MKSAKLSFDYLFHRLAVKVPLLGKPVSNYYLKHRWFQRFSKFAVSTFLMFWLVKGPLLWMLTLVLPSINLVLIEIPDYVLGGFLSGIIVTVVGFFINEGWVWKKHEKTEN